MPLVCDALRGLEALSARLGAWTAAESWQRKGAAAYGEWLAAAGDATADTGATPPSDAQVLGAIDRQSTPDDVIVCAAGGLPGEMHKLWRSKATGDYHLEYGYSCMGYEIAGGLGVKLARPDAHVVVVVGDGSYMMMSSAIHTSVVLGRTIVVVVLDNHGFGCINRLQQACGGAPFNNLLGEGPGVDFAAHAGAMGAHAEAVTTIAELSAALERARGNARTSVIVIETDPAISSSAGGAWWDVAVPEVSERESVREARAAYARAIERRHRR
jgi:3D-(3,5/4)-trihydroxycyclohexane-1,2-dione acylhydrolase (decyclizing)